MDIFAAVRRKDLTRVMYLVEERLVPLQQRDAWDATPLYYASFTGNLEIIEYLLAKGARCEVKTFDGERCLYAALNDQVRNALLTKGFQRAGARRHDLYLEFLEKLYDDPAAFPDLEVTNGGQRVTAHRFVVAARCPAFGDGHAQNWSAERPWADLQRSFPEPLAPVIRWCYTNSLEVPASAAGSCGELLRSLGLDTIAEELNAAERDLTGDESAVIALEPERSVSKAALQNALDSDLLRARDLAHLTDIILRAADGRLAAHKAVLCGRSDYFAVLLTSPSFREGHESSALRAQGRSDGGVSPLEVGLEDVGAAALRIGLRWMYCDRIDPDLPSETLLEVMRLGDRLMSEGLKQKSSVLLQPHVTPSSALFLLSEAVRMDAHRLTDTCLRVVAEHLLRLRREPLLADLVRESAAGVENREDVDSVPIVDDLRYHISRLHGDGLLSDDSSDWDEDGTLVSSGLDRDAELLDQDFQLLDVREQKLYVLEELLEKLGIEA